MSAASTESLFARLPAVEAPIGYVPPALERAEIRVYPATSGLETVRPETWPVMLPIRDMRPAADRIRLDVQGFELHRQPTSFTDFYDADAVRARYYPEVAATLEALTGAGKVIVFDHNVRSAVRSARGEPGVREPVDQAHNDYTEASGPRRRDAILEQAGRADLAGREFALVNLWRPIIGPVLDTPLALCDAATVAPEHLVTTEIHHFAEGDIETPAHRGVIYSLRPNAAHRWYYASAMQPDECLLLKCYDSRNDGRARFMPHTGFVYPECPADYVPRESIEARTLVVF